MAGSNRDALVDAYIVQDRVSELRILHFAAYHPYLFACRLVLESPRADETRLRLYVVTGRPKPRICHFGKLVDTCFLKKWSVFF